MHTTTRPRDTLKLNPTAEPSPKVTTNGSQFLAGASADRSYVQERRTRLRRRRLVGFSLCASLWALSVVPLARDAMDGRDGAALVLTYAVVGVLTLGIAAVIRSVYVFLTKKQFWSPWIFVIAAALAIGGYAVQSAGVQTPSAGTTAGASAVGANWGSGA